MFQVKCESLAIPLKHIVISHEMVGKTNRLGVLQMGIAWHDGFHMFFSQIQQNTVQIRQLIQDMAKPLL